MLETLETLYRVIFLPSSMVGSMEGLPKVNSSMAGLGDGVRGETPSRPYASICARWCSSEAAGRHCTGAKLMVEARPAPARHPPPAAVVLAAAAHSDFNNNNDIVETCSFLA